MDYFSISEISRLSGIKSFTIRVWEKRYNALNPDRSPGNTRYYNNNQLRRLLNIVSLMERNHKISELAVLPDTTLFRMIEEQRSDEPQGQESFFIAQLIGAGFTYDESHFSNVFAQCLLRFGVKNAYSRVIYPMLERMGTLWNSNRINISNEHFITNLLRQKLLAAIDLLPSPRSAEGSWLLFLPENEFHEAGLLVAHYLIRVSGRKSLYLGANLPFEALVATATYNHPSNILFFFVHHRTSEEMQEYLSSIAGALKWCHIFVAGAGLSGRLKPTKRTHFLESVSALDQSLNTASD